MEGANCGKLTLMEKAILRTLSYGDIFDYPMKAWEIHKWLIGRKVTLRQVDKALGKLYQASSIKHQGGYYYLPNRKGLVAKRVERKKQSEKYINTAKWVSGIFKLIPWILLVGVSGGLAMENAARGDDIDLFVVTQRKRLWLTRLGLLGILGVLGKRRKRGDFGENAAGKVCINIILDEDSLVQKDKDIYLAHEVLQMRVLWERSGIYQKFLEENSWVFKYLPNWVGTKGFMNYDLRLKSKSTKIHLTSIINHQSVIDKIERFFKWMQLKYMGKPFGEERVYEGALYFHPEDKRKEILAALDKER